MVRVSVVLPTYNRLNRLKHVLAGFENQTYAADDFEVIVVSDGSQDGTGAYLENIDSPLQLIPVSQSNRGEAAARNRGLKHTGQRC